MDRLRLLIFTTLFLLVVLIGTSGFMKLEGLSAADAAYFSIVTISTVGYGDIHPSSAFGKLLAVLLILSGGGTFFGIFATITEMIISRNERNMRLEKLNLIIGVFFSEVGMKLLRYCIAADDKVEELRANLQLEGKWSKDKSKTVDGLLMHYDYKINADKIQLVEIKELLKDKSDVLIRLLENPTTLEHEVFTEVLRAVFHLREELSQRFEKGGLTKDDYTHLQGDTRRAYMNLTREWFVYMQYLKSNYPYLFAYAVRTSPFIKSEPA